MPYWKYRSSHSFGSVPYGGGATGPWTSIADVGRDTRMLEVTGHDWNSPSFTYRVTAWNANGTKVSAEYGAPNSDYDDPNYSNGLPPTNLDANLISPNGTIKLTYTDPGQRSFYALQHSEDGEHFVTVSYPQYQGGPPEALFTGGKPGSTSFFRMYAEAWGDKSSYTSVVSVDLPPLSPPTLLDVEISRNYVQTSRPWVARVRWSDVNLMAHEYEIEVKGEGKDWHRVAGGQYTAGYADLSGFAEGYAYEFRVRAVVKADSYRVVYGHTTGATGTYSDALTRTPLARPYAPRGLWAKPAADGATAVDVYWADHQHTDDGHVVVRREAGSGQWYQIVPGVAPFTIGSDANGWAVPDPTRKTTAVDETTFTDTTVKPLTRYQYQVFAANDMGASQTNGGYVEASAGTVDLVLDGLPEERTGSPNEHHAGAFIPVNDDDSDGDGVPDYADGFDWRLGNESPGATPTPNRDALSDKDAFTPMTVTVPAGTDLSTATFTFNYSGSHPGHSANDPATEILLNGDAYSLTSYAGSLRVWRKAANVARDGRALESGGDYVRPGAAYTAAQLGITAGQPLPLWVEGVKAGAGDVSVTVSTTRVAETDVTVQDKAKVTTTNDFKIVSAEWETWKPEELEADWEPNVPLDENIGGSGKRIFPDKLKPFDKANNIERDPYPERRKNVFAVARFDKPVAGITVYFSVWDVDDIGVPTEVDPNDLMPDGSFKKIGRDNRDGNRAAAAPAGEAPTHLTGVTDAKGIARVTFVVTMQPGNNYRLYATLAKDQDADLTQKMVDAHHADVRPELPFVMRRSVMLSVWRNLYLEADSLLAPPAGYVPDAGDVTPAIGVGGRLRDPNTGLLPKVFNDVGYPTFIRVVPAPAAWNPNRHAPWKQYESNSEDLAPARDIKSEPSFWSIQVVGAYELSAGLDGDPDTEEFAVGLQFDQGAFIYLETIRDRAATPILPPPPSPQVGVDKLEQRVVVHEVLHNFLGLHSIPFDPGHNPADEFIMFSPSLPWMSDVNFRLTPEQANLIRYGMIF